MHGIIMLTVKDLVVTKFGEKAWVQMCGQAKCATDFVSNQPYDDAIVYDLVKAGSALLKAKPEDLLEQVGYWFIVYLHKKTSYGQLLEMIGSDLGEVLSQINKLHAHLLKVAHFPTIMSPTFKVTHRKGNSMRLHYTPGKESRQGLSPLVVGLVKGLGAELLKLKEVTVTQIKTKEADGIDVLFVEWKTDTEGDGHEAGASESTTTATQKAPLKHGLNAKSLGRLFPFHIMFDKECNIVQAGPALQRIVPLETGDAMSQFFTIKEPEACAFPNFKTIYSHRKLSPFTLGHAYDDDTTFLLHGEMVWCQGKQTVCFACSPVLNSIEEARYFGIDMSDFPLCDQAQARLMTAHAAAAYKPTDSESVAPESNGNCGGSTIVSSDKAERARGTSGSGRIFKTLFGPSPSKTRKNRGGDEEEPWRIKSKPHSADCPAVTETCPLAAMAPPAGSFDSVSASGRATKLPTTTSLDSIPAVTKGTKIRFPIGSEQELINNERLRRGRTGSNITAGARSAEGSPRQSLGSATSSSSSSAVHSFECGAAPIVRGAHAGAERLLHVFTETLLEDSWDDFPLMRTMLELDMASAAPRGHEHPLSEAIVSFYTIKGKSQHLLTSSFIDQIAASPREESAVLFREESIAVRLFKAFIHQQAAHYIDYCIGNLITTVNALEKPLEEFLEHVCKSSSQCPAPVRRILRIVGREVGKRWSEMNLQAIANLIFLRFLSPAIVSPHRGKTTSQRTLMLITKLLNNLMNNVEFGEKESYMTSLNPFISPDNLLLVQQFMQELVANEMHSKRGASDSAEFSERYRLLAALDEIKRSLLQLLPALYTSAAAKPKLQQVLQKLVSVFLCELPTEVAY
ncbi:heme NO binding domain containing protein [Acanthamoeba castellanii str. Neff]|uniref:guanylate cyclase n=1 Tax=Acanthamoeba castellanii (strain ATCC 30010 / Neff) TaxID=1257118 RepID=L8GS74_ACACF|nr:heme NO binding domain containing protein [Acanthamoeba castellanii str. Neff]ELR15845.1 heme NO binding domain containing protein [Acanthamoeba castellanii str. Neff]